MKLFFLDLDTHRDFGSSFFFLNLLRNYFDVSVKYLEGRQKRNKCTIDDVKDCDVIVYWQVRPTMRFAKQVNKPTIYIPMYDAESFNRWKWRRIALTGASVISFSRKMTEMLSSFGVRVLHITYYPKGDKIYPGNPRKLFFWERGNVSFEDLKKVIDIDYFEEIGIRYSPWTKNYISVEDIAKYKVKVIDSARLNTRADYHELFKDYGVFVAPRRKEGIGLSFLEAMSLGKCVIANDDATMNEYITHGETGLLVDFDSKDSDKIVLSERLVTDIQRNVIKKYSIGVDAWSQEEEKVNSFIIQSKTEYRGMSIVDNILWWAYSIPQFIVDVKHFVASKLRRC